jgi:hypothetical protein
MFDRSFFVDIVLDSLKKKLAQIPDLNPEKCHVVHFDYARPHLADHETQANNLTRPSHPAYTSDLAPADFCLFGDLKVMLQGSSFEIADQLQEKVAAILMLLPISTFRAALQERKSRRQNRIPSSFKGTSTSLWRPGSRSPGDSS